MMESPYDVRKKHKTVINDIKNLVMIFEYAETFNAILPTNKEIIKNLKTIIEKAK